MATTALVPASSASAITRGSDHQAAGDTFKGMLSAAFGCKTSETALALLGQVMALEHPTTTMEPERINTMRMNAIAMLAELQPTTATEAMLAAQMVGTHRAAMTFLTNATKPEDSFDGRDRNVLRALRLMRLFTEQVEAMSKLKGKGGQQRVVVEHVTVAAGGQAIVGAVMPGGGGRVATTNDEPHERRRGWLKKRQSFRRLDDGPTLWGDDEASHRLPVSGHAEPTTLSVARRQEHGAENGRRA